MQIIEPKYFMLNCKYIGVGLSYEDYLLEILNWSGYFRSKSEDKSEYIAPKTEDHGEADAYSTDYQIDFKLLIDEEMMRGLNKNKPTVDKKFIDKGIYDTEKAVDAFYYAMNSASDLYKKYFGYAFTVTARYTAAKEMADNFTYDNI